MERVIFFLFFLLSTSGLFAQTMTDEQIENDLAKRYEKINSFPYGGGDKIDSLEWCDSLFRIKFAYYTSHYPSTLAYPFDSLQKENKIRIVTSRDKLFRIYSWDTRDGGTMHAFNNLFQFKSGGKVFSKLAADTGQGKYYDPGVVYGSIYMLKAGQQTYYMTFGHGTYSTINGGTRINFFTITNHHLNDTTKMIQTKDGRLVHSISFFYNTGFDYPGDFLIPNGVEYDSIQQKLSIPVVNHSNDSVTNRSDIYRFNGKYFEYITTTDMTNK